MALAEFGGRGATPLFRINIREERIKKVLATGFVNEQKTVLAITERPRFVEVFPGMLGSFNVPLPCIKDKKFIDYSPRRR